MCTIGRTSVGTARKSHHRPDRTECTTRCEQDRTDYGSKRGRNSFLNTALAPIAQKSIVVDSYGSNGINVITQENYEFLRDSFFNYALLLKQEAVHTPGKSILLGSFRMSLNSLFPTEFWTYSITGLKSMYLGNCILQ